MKKIKPLFEVRAMKVSAPCEGLIKLLKLLDREIHRSMAIPTALIGRDLPTGFTSDIGLHRGRGVGAGKNDGQGG